MFNDDITPEAVGGLLADLTAMLAVEEAVSAPGKRVRIVPGLSIRLTGDTVELRIKRTQPIHVRLADMLATLGAVARGEVGEFACTGPVSEGRVLENERGYVVLSIRPIATVEIDPEVFWSALDAAGIMSKDAASAYVAASETAIVPTSLGRELTLRRDGESVVFSLPRRAEVRVSLGDLDDALGAFWRGELVTLDTGDERAAFIYRAHTDLVWIIPGGMDQRRGITISSDAFWDGLFQVGMLA